MKRVGRNVRKYLRTPHRCGSRGTVKTKHLGGPESADSRRLTMVFKLMEKLDGIEELAIHLNGSASHGAPVPGP